MKVKCKVCEKELDVVEVTCGECVEKIVCEWKKTPLNFQYVTGCKFSFDTDIQFMVFGDDLPLKRCPECGKRIKYVEVE